MPTQDTSLLKEKILFVCKKRGPSLPVHIASETGISALFAAAFLSELVSEKKLILSHLRVGNSPLYLVPGQEPMLEEFSQHLKSKEKDAFLLLKETRFLKDSDQEPAIRVALRHIRDFAIPFKKDDEIFWRYFIIPESEFKIKGKPKKVEEKKEQGIKEKQLDIFNKTPIKKTSAKKKAPQKANEKFFNKVKGFLVENRMALVDIENFKKNELNLRVRREGEEKLLVAYNKKRISENDMLKASKRATELDLSYIILSLGGPLKKVSNLIGALKNLSSIETFK